MRLELGMLLNAAILARREPYDAADELRRVQRCEQERIDLENLANSRSTTTYTSAASILIGAGVKPPPPIVRTPATRDPRFDQWARFIAGLIDAYKAVQPLTRTAAVLGRDIAALDRSGDIKALTDSLVRNAGLVPHDWPDRVAFARSLRLDSITLLERGGRLAAIAKRYALAGQWFAEAERLCTDEGLAQRASRNRLAQVDVGIHAGTLPQRLLELLGEALLPRFPTSLDKSEPDVRPLLHFGRLGIPPLLPFAPPAIHARYGPANTLDGAYSRLLHAILLDDSGRAAEARAGLEEARSFFEPRLGTIVAPTRDAIVALIAETAAKEEAGRDYGETLDQLNELLRHRMVAMIYCEVAKRLNAGNPKAVRFYDAAASRLNLLIETDNLS